LPKISYPDLNSYGKRLTLLNLNIMQILYLTQYIITIIILKLILTSFGIHSQGMVEIDNGQRLSYDIPIGKSGVFQILKFHQFAFGHGKVQTCGPLEGSRNKVHGTEIQFHSRILHYGIEIPGQFGEARGSRQRDPDQLVGGAVPIPRGIEVQSILEKTEFQAQFQLFVLLPPKKGVEYACWT